MNDIINKIKSKGYWRVIVRPSKDFYREDRFGLSDLKKTIEESQIRLRGWYYPHIDRNTVKIINQTTIYNECDFEGHIEHWELMTSGQFVHIFSMQEDYVISEQKVNEIRTDFAFNKNEAKDINLFLEVVSAVYRFTEIYKFASNFSQAVEMQDVEEFEVIIELYNVENRLLFIWDWSRDLHSPYICHVRDGKISFTNKYTKNDLIANFDNYSLEIAIKTFQLFNWENPSLQVLGNDQKKLLERRL